MRELGKGVIEIALTRSISVLTDEELDLLVSVATESQRPVTWLALLGRSDMPGVCRTALDRIEPLLAQGLRIPPQGHSPADSAVLHAESPVYLCQLAVVERSLLIGQSPEADCAVPKTLSSAKLSAKICRSAGRSLPTSGIGCMSCGSRRMRTKQYLNKSIAEIAAEWPRWEDKIPIDTIS